MLVKFNKVTELAAVRVDWAEATRLVSPTMGQSEWLWFSARDGPCDYGCPRWDVITFIQCNNVKLLI